MTMDRGPFGEAMTGLPVYTSDGDQLGEVKEVRGRYFKVDAPLQPDYWLSADCIRTSSGGRVSLVFDKAHLGDYRTETLDDTAAMRTAGTATGTAAGTDCIDLLMEMHRDARAELRHILQTSDPAEAGRMWRNLEPVLKVHEQMEETYLYDPLANEPNRGAVLSKYEPRHEQEVQQLETMIAQLDGMDPSAPQWRTRLQLMQQTLLTHMEEEESQIFSRVREVWDSDRRRQAGRLMEMFKEQRTART